MAISHETVMNGLEWAYERAIHGPLGLDSAEDLANFYRQRGGSPQEQSDALIRWQVAKAGASGFVTGLGGLAMMPVAVPINLGSVFYVQLRMIAAIACLGGYDVRDDRVRTLSYLCLCGGAATDVAKDLGIQVGVKLTQAAVHRIPRTALLRIERKIGLRLVGKFGQKGALNMGKVMPVIGGIVGATVDSLSTQAIGRVAQRTFELGEASADADASAQQ